MKVLVLLSVCLLFFHRQLPAAGQSISSLFGYLKADFLISVLICPWAFRYLISYLVRYRLVFFGQWIIYPGLYAFSHIII